MAVPQSIAWRLTNSAPHDDDACGGQPGGVFGHLAAVADVAIRPATTSVSGNRHAMRITGGLCAAAQVRPCRCSELGGLLVVGEKNQEMGLGFSLGWLGNPTINNTFAFFIFIFIEIV